MKSFLKEERGSFTIEATLVFPAFLFLVLTGVFLCIIVFQWGTANYMAQKASSQVAYTWNNSHKDLDTGEFGSTNYTGLPNGDPLYWRVTDNGLLGVFGLDGLFRFDDLAEDKLRLARINYSGSMDVRLTYENWIVYSEVQATVSTNLFMPSFLTNLLGKDKLEVTSSRVVSDTPELIRTFNFSKYIWKESGLGNVFNGIKESIGKFFENDSG